MALSSPVSPRDLGLKEKRFQSVEEVEAAYNLLVRRMNEVYKYNRRDHDRLTEDVGDVSIGAESAVVCTAYLSTAQSVGSLSDVQIELDATLVNTGSKFDAGNNRITITDAGNYLVSAQISMAAPSADQIYALRVKDSGGNVVAMSYENRVAADANGFAISVCMPIAMSASDWLALYLFHDTGSNRDVRGDNIAFYSYPTYLSVIKI